MRLISCYIAGFGTIRDRNFIFKPGLNAILEENGWGKTTFCVFLKAMFYGMEYSKGTKTLHERQKYEPWDGGSYGGSLVFATGGKEYRIERSFGRTDKSDRFSLIDLSTNQQSSDFSDQIGEELFSVDRESFEKSIFVPQNALDTGITDSMNAHMGRGSRVNRDDVTHFEEAIASIENQIRDYNRNSKTNTGRLRLLQQKISLKQELADRIPATQEAARAAEGRLLEKKSQLHQLEEQKKALNDRVTEQVKREQALGAFRQKRQQLAESEKELEKYQTFFAKGIPSPETMEEVTDADHQLAVRGKELEELRAKVPKEAYVTDLMKLFPEEIPTPGQFAAWSREAAHLKDLRIQQSYAVMSEEDREQLAELREYFLVKNPSREELDLISSEINNLASCTGRVSELTKQSEELERSREEKIADRHSESGFGLSLVTGLIALVLVLGGGAFLTLYASDGGFLRQILGLVFVGAAVVVAVGGFSGQRRRQSAYQQVLSDLDQEIEQAREERQEAVKRRDASRKICIDFLSLFPEDEQSMQQHLTEIRIKKENFDRLTAAEARAIDNSAGAVEELANASMRLYTQLQPYADSYEMDLYHEFNEEALLQRLQEDAQAYRDYVTARGQVENLEEQVMGWRKSIGDFLADYPLTEKSRHERIAQIRRNMDRLADLTDRVEELRKEVSEEEGEVIQVSEGQSVEEMQREQALLDASVVELTQVISELKDDWTNLLEELQDYEEAGDEARDLREQETVMLDNVRILELTRDYLNRARESYLARYMGPLQDNMQGYLEILGGRAMAERPERFTLDIDLNPKLIYKEQQKRGEFLSAGYHDLIALAARFALVDTIFSKDQPMVILDDPFNNLDQDKVKRALAFLGQIAGRRQLIYLTCHPSRMPAENGTVPF
ncbi:AAA domain protein [Shuttleworthella sp. MSX8B]|uniref:AAA family ATPase n=1 Tax=Shuttleworthella sp. MSX8B TaxID=936574 RepID=UPI00044BF4F0|nr:AAA family ATPase [Shuttleworthia sp. MSX8B]EUB14819.1 AAA domain protein [Shuttleworthia sp. MSX8B]